MLIKNDKPIRIIGYPESSMTEEYCQFFKKDGFDDFEVILPEDFKSLVDKEKYQYIIAFSLDMKLRKEICDLLDDLDLDCVTYVNDLTYIFDSCKIGKGCFISYGVLISWDCSIGDHCYFGMRSIISHDCSIGKNCILSADSGVAGKTTIGNNCSLMFSSRVLNKLSLTDGVTIGAFSNLTKNAEIEGTYVGRIARLMKPETDDRDL
jgi:carbonic anhydrase/acetyltransferase-like protein (isoleucine patch superfamily)